MKARIIPLSDIQAASPAVPVTAPPLAWMSGSKLNASSEQLPVYGTLGVASPSNLPGGRMDSFQWRDLSGNLWIFGGFGIDSTGKEGELNDLWKYSGGQWTWIGGSNVANAAGNYGTRNIASTTNSPGARGTLYTWQSPPAVVVMHSKGANWVDSSGNLWLFGGYGKDSAGNTGDMNDLWKFDTTTLQWTWISGSDQIGASGTYGTLQVGSTSNIPGARMGPASWTDASGKFWLFGGTGIDGSGGQGDLNDLWEFDPSTLQWTWISGSDTKNATATYGTQGVGSTSNTPGARISALGAVDSSGNFWLFGGTRFTMSYNDLWKFDPSTYEWTWVSGSSSASRTGVYGTQGVGSTSNYPGGRAASAFWIDSHDLLWIFGGSASDVSATGNYNDLWKFDPTNGEWTWVSGSSSVEGAANYGTQGVAASSNTPGARVSSSFWMDGSDRLWIFGGTTEHIYTTSNLGGGFRGPFQNDLWSFDTTNGEWTWVAGPSNDVVAGAYGTKGVAAPSNQPGARNHFKLWSDTAGHVWLFGGDAVDRQGFKSFENDLWKYDPSSGQWTWVTGSDTINAFGTYGAQGAGGTSYTPGARSDCMGWSDSQGRFWVFGGDGMASTNYGGTLNELWMFDPSNSEWTWIAGSNTTMGSKGAYGTKGLGSTSNLPGARTGGATAGDGTHELWLFGGNGTDGAGNSGYLNDLWKFDPTSQEWTWVSGSDTRNQVGTYGSQGVESSSNIPGARIGATAWVDPSGKLWIFGGLGYDSAGNTGYLNDLWKYDPANGQWTWVAGSTLRSSAGDYGTQGFGSASTAPAARQLATGWEDASGNLWLFGGFTQDSGGTYGSLNDLWKFDTSLGEWIWVSGSSEISQPGHFGTQGVADSANIPSSRDSAAAIKDSSGNVWLFGGYGVDSTGFGGDLYDLWKIAP